MNVDEAMRRALELAAEAAAAGDVPVGAVVLDAHGTVIGEGHNVRQATGDPLAHAEIIALRRAAAWLAGHADKRDGERSDDPSVSGSQRSGWNLSGCTLVVTLEPCPMCTWACLQTHIGRIVFGTWDCKLGACGSVWDIPRDPHVGHQPEVFGGVRQGECTEALTGFFTDRRRR